MPAKARVMLLTGGWLAAAAAAYLQTEFTSARPARALAELCSAPARMVWCRQAGPGRDALGTNLLLMALDSAEYGGPRPLLNRQGSYWKPMLTPRGDRVVYTDFPRATMYVVSWQGSVMRELGRGFALHVAQDPVTAEEWVYAVSADGRQNYSGKPLIRFRLDDPFRIERVWDQTLVHFDNLRVSADGRLMGGLFPWPQAGVAELSNGAWRVYGRGCWPDLSPDNQGLLWIFDGSHRRITLHAPGNRDRWSVDLSEAPGVAGEEVDCPRWSNRIRYMTMSGPRRRTPAEGGNDPAGAEEIYAGRFDEKLGRMERWARLTHDHQADFFPDLWIAATAAWHAASAPFPAPAAAGASRSLVVRARLRATSVTPAAAEIAPYRNALVVYEYEVESVVTGDYPHARLRVAHWGLVDGEARAVPRQKQHSYTLRLEPLDNRPELEGERVIMDLPSDRLPLYYEIPP